MRTMRIEGSTLYVSPGRFARMQTAVVEGEDPDKAAYRALQIAGVQHAEIMTLIGRETKIVVDPAMED